MDEADAILARRAASGDAAAFDELVGRHIPRLHRWLVSSGTTSHDADDVVQEACLRAWSAIANYNSRWAFTTWIFTIANRIRLDLVTRRREHVVLTMDRVQPEEPDPLPAEGLWSRARALLSEDEYRALWLRYAEDLEPAEIAQVLGSNAIVIRVRLHRARRRLERALRTTSGYPMSEVLL